MSDNPINVRVTDLDAQAEAEAAERARMGMENNEYDNFGSLSDEQSDALDERITQEAQAELDAQEITDEAITPQEVEDDEAARKQAEYEERTRKWREEQDAREARIKPFVKQLALLINQNLGKLNHNGAKLTGAWCNEAKLIITTASDEHIQIYPVVDSNSYWTVQPAILAHAKMLGHEPTDFAWTHDIGKVSACNKCDAMVRIVSKDDGTEDVIAAAYMATCKGRR